VVALVHARREPRRSRIAGRASRADDARFDPERRAHRDRHRRWPGAALGRPRTRRRPVERSGTSPRGGERGGPVSDDAVDVLSLIGNTPLVELATTDTGPCQLFLKLENQNPGGSIKDRIGLSMIEVAEREGKIHPGSTLVEATA